MNKDVYGKINKIIVDSDLSQQRFAHLNGLNQSSFNSAMNKKRCFSYRTIAILIDRYPELRLADFEIANARIENSKISE